MAQQRRSVVRGRAARLAALAGVVAASLILTVPSAARPQVVDPGPAITTSDGLVPRSAIVIGSKTSNQLQVSVGEQTFPFTAFPVQQVLGGWWRDDSGRGLDAFLYNPGPGPDGLLQVRPAGDGFAASLLSLPVNGTFQPVTGDFDGNGRTDILWYAPGPAADYLWLFARSGEVVSRPLTINGTYTPIPFTTDRSRILWYGKGSRPDSIWTWGPGASVHSAPVTVNGSDLQPLVGRFTSAAQGHDQILWYSPGGRESLWTFEDTGIGHRSSPLPDMGAGYRPKVVGAFGGSLDRYAYRGVFWYRPGPGADPSWTFDGLGTEAPKASAGPVINGTYPWLTDTLNRFEPNGQLRQVDGAVLLSTTSAKVYETGGGNLGAGATVSPVPADPTAAITPFTL